MMFSNDDLQLVCNLYLDSNRLQVGYLYYILFVLICIMSKLKVSQKVMHKRIFKYKVSQENKVISNELTMCFSRKCWQFIYFFFFRQTCSRTLVIGQSGANKIRATM